MNFKLDFLLLSLPGEGGDGGKRDASDISALAPTLTLPRKGRELTCIDSV